MKFTILLLININAFVRSDIFNCPSSPVMQSFDASSYVGKWYEIEKLSVGFEDNLKCVFAQYSSINATHIGVQNNGFNQLTNVLDTINGYAYVPNLSTPNHLLVALRVPINGFFIERIGKYDVWATDYVSYSLVYSCQFVPSINTKVENVFILSRTKTLNNSILEQLKEMLSQKGFDTSKLSVTTQDCDY